MEPQIWISALALIVSAIVLARSIRRDNRSDDSNEASQTTTILIKLETIGTNVSEIKTDIRSVKQDVRDHGDRITKLEQKYEHLLKIVNMYHHEGSSEN